jgi:hypothetical protein
VSVTIEVLTIAIGTAIMAALIVAADWDLAFIRAWQSFSARPVHSGHHVESPLRDLDAPTPWWQQAGRDPGTADAAWTGPVGSAKTGLTEADEWLAAAAAYRVRRLRALTLDGISTRSGSPSPDVQEAGNDEGRAAADAA